MWLSLWVTNGIIDPIQSEGKIQTGIVCNLFQFIQLESWKKKRIWRQNETRFSEFL